MKTTVKIIQNYKQAENYWAKQFLLRGKTHKNGFPMILVDFWLMSQFAVNDSSSLRPGFEWCSEIMNDPLYLRFVCLEQDENFPEY